MSKKKISYDIKLCSLTEIDDKEKIDKKFTMTFSVYEEVSSRTVEFE